MLPLDSRVFIALISSRSRLSVACVTSMPSWESRSDSCDWDVTMCLSSTCSMALNRAARVAGRCTGGVDSLIYALSGGLPNVCAPCKPPAYYGIEH